MRGRFRGPHRRFFSLFIVAAAVALGSCSEDSKVTDPEPKTIVTPGAPTGFNSARPGMAINFCVDDGGGGPTTEYQWDFDAAGDTLMTDWLSDSCIVKAWAEEGQYVVRARARANGITTEWTEGLTVTIINETVSYPFQPTVDDAVVVGTTASFCASGAESTLDHPIEYRFFLDPRPPTEWGVSKCATMLWTVPGSFQVRAQARCLLHPGIFSDLSQSITFMGISGADTRILRVISSPTLDETAGQSIDFEDATPDTVPQDSWLTIIVEGSNPGYDFGTCDDAVNRCIGFQFQYETIDEAVANSQVISDWLHDEPFDGNPNGPVDTLRINMGTRNYTINGRAVDEFGADPEPASLPIFANYAPTLDDFYVQHHDGTIVRNGETLLWNWWSPANDDTVDVNAGLRKKTFSFAIKASGHDDPRDPMGSGIKMWQYFFVASNDPVFFGDFGQAGDWLEAQQLDVVCDTVEWTVTYPIDDVDGDTVFANLPDWINRGWDFAIRGRDSGPGDQFEQKIRLNGQTVVTTAYSTTPSGRRTGYGFQQFSMVIEK